MWKEFLKMNNINSRILSTITEELKYDKPTKVQFEVIPRFVHNKDVIVKACTGSGKTIAYLVPLLQMVLKYFEEKEKEHQDSKYSYFTPKEGKVQEENKLEQIEVNNDLGIIAIILIPTRELGTQVYDVLLKFQSALSNIKTALLLGGKKLEIDSNKFKDFTPNIIVSTPGRLSDLDKQIGINFRNLQVLIFDEADKMLELGLKPELSYLLSKFNKTRRTGLFSATMNSQVDNIVLTGMRNPIYIDVQIKSDNIEDNFIKSLTNQSKELINVIDDYSNRLSEIKSISQEIPKQLDNYYILIESYRDKLPTLINLLYHSIQKGKKVMVFFATCNSVEYYTIIIGKMFKALYKDKIKEENLFKLHSKISNKKRKKEYLNFLNSKSGVLLTTDLSSRGIDVPDLDIVVQVDPPKNEEVFVHRVGRTARVGKKGESYLVLLDNHEKNFLNYLQAKSISLKKKEISEFGNEEDNKLELALKESDTNEKSNNLNLRSCEKLMFDYNTSDKWIYDKAVKAFVSFVKFYSENDLKYIFDVKLLDVGDLAKSFQLLRLPRIKEILGKKIKGFENNAINPKDLKYLDSNIKSQMNEKAKKIEMLRESKEIRKQIVDIQKDAKNSRTKKDKKKAKKESNIQEWEDFANEEKLFKQFKKGKITKEEYDKLFMKTSK